MTTKRILKFQMELKNIYIYYILHNVLYQNDKYNILNDIFFLHKIFIIIRNYFFY